MNNCTIKSDLSVEMDAALARLPACLADSRARAALQTVAGMLPQALVANPLGLELRLAGPTIVDVFAAARPGEAAFDALIEVLRNPLHSGGWTDSMRASDLAGALTRWRSRQGLLHAIASYLLIEVDAPADPSAAVAVPSIFLAPRGARDVLQPGQVPNAFHRFVEGTTMAMAELSGLWPDPTTAEALARVLQAIKADGDDGEIFAVGAMLSRSAGPAMRIAIRRMTSAGIQSVLKAAGRAQQAEVLLAHTRSAPAAKQVLHFEIGPGAEQRVGLELSPAHDWKKASVEGWPALLDYLVACGLADAERASVVPGLIDASAQPLWGLAHVKLAADASAQLPFAKLYVGLLHQSSGVHAIERD